MLVDLATILGFWLEWPNFNQTFIKLTKSCGWSIENLVIPTKIFVWGFIVCYSNNDITIIMCVIKIIVCVSVTQIYRFRNSM